MSLMDLLLNEPSAASRAMSVLGMMQQSGQGLRPSGPGLANLPTGSVQGEGPGAALARQIARKLEARGFDVSGVEGFQGTGQISSGHVPNSEHYTGEAGDVNYYGDGRWAGENQALNWADQWLQRRYGDALSELLWQVPDHYDHLHYGTRPGG